MCKSRDVPMILIDHGAAYKVVVVLAAAGMIHRNEHAVKVLGDSHHCKPKDECQKNARRKEASKIRTGRGREVQPASAQPGSWYDLVKVRRKPGTAVS